MMLGPAGRAIGIGPEMVTANPALISTGFTAGGGRWNLSTTGVSLAGGFGLGSEVTAAAGLVYLGHGGIIRRNQQGQATGEYSYSTGSALAGVSFPLSGWAAAGTSLGVSWESADGEGGTGFTVNAGIGFFPMEGMKAGLAVTGLGTTPSWNGIRKDMPTEIQAGASLKVTDFLTTFAGGSMGLHTADSFGGGLSVASRGLGASAGYTFAPDQDELTGFFAGAEYRYTSGGTYTLNAAVQQRDQLSWPVFAGISVSF